MTSRFRRIALRIERREQRLERLLKAADSADDFARINRLVARLDRARKRLDDLTEQPSTRNDQAGRDTFTFAVKAQEGYTQIQITAVDSPDDDRWTAGDDLLLQTVASTQFCDDGVAGRSYRNTRVVATEPVEEQVINIGDSLWNEWENYEQVKLSLVRGDDNEDTMASQVFATAEIYA